MLTFDLDGTLINYGSTTAATRINVRLTDSLPAGAPIAIATNQGGIAFSRHSPDKFPTPHAVAKRINHTWTYLTHAGHQVTAILIATYHPHAKTADIEWAARQMRNYVALYPCLWHVYANERARKPHPLMLQVAGATVYYGDSNEDAIAAANAGIPFVAVPRFQ